MDSQPLPPDQDANVTVVGPDDDNDPSTVKPAWYWIKDSKGFGSVTVTMVFVSFWVTTLAYLMSIVEHVGPVTIRTFDVAATSAYFIPILTLYFGRKWTEAKVGSSNQGV
jgi:hypothetical protein